jgi:hypothetical protein
MNIFFMIFGEKAVHHVQAYLSIRTFQKQLGPDDQIFVMATHPELYASSGVEVIPISDDTITEWKGKHGFFWRAKIKAIEYMAVHYPDHHLMYLDTDTILYGSLSDLKRSLDEGCGLMHLNEGHPSEMTSRSLRMWRQVEGHTYGNVTIGKQHCMYNAGVVAIPQDKLAEVSQLALTLCDGMLAEDVERVTIEQYSLSIALYERTSLQEADKFIGHYWGNKPAWEAIAYELMARAYMEKLTIEDELARIDIETLRQTPYYIHHSSTARRLKGLIDSCFKDKDLKYL